MIRNGCGRREISFPGGLKEAKARGLTFRVEQCPDAWCDISDNFHNNIAYTPGTWIALHRICEKYGVGDQFRIHYDPSHAILMGQDTRSIFQYLKGTGYNFLIGGFHVKGQVINAQGVSAWGYGGQTIQRGDWIDGKPLRTSGGSGKPLVEAAVLCEHELPERHGMTPGYLQNRTVDWLDHQLAARSYLRLDVAPPNSSWNMIPARENSGCRSPQADLQAPSLSPQDRRSRSLQVRFAA